MRWVLKTVLPPADREGVLPEVDALYALQRRRRGGPRAALWYARQIPSFALRLRFERARRRRAPANGSSRPGSVPWAALCRDALRAPRRSPGWAAMTVAALSIGVAGVSVVFGVANWVLLRPVPGVVAPEELLTVRLGSTETDEATWPISHPDLLRLRERSQTTAGFIGAVDQDVYFATDGSSTAERLEAEVVTADYFAVLGVRLIG
jgi:hypothetical protein